MTTRSYYYYRPFGRGFSEGSFVDDDPRTAEVLSKTLMLSRDSEIRDPGILAQIRAMA
jgi:hypothetical protein